MAENLRLAVEQAAIVHQGSDILDVMTLSIGISTKPSGRVLEPDALFKEADSALYKAKHNGRNQHAKYVFESKAIRCADGT